MLVSHPANVFFAKQLRALMESSEPRILRGQRTRLNPNTLWGLLCDANPSLSRSPTQFYRYCNGEASPKLPLVNDVAALFEVSPHYFSNNVPT